MKMPAEVLLDELLDALGIDALRVLTPGATLAVPVRTAVIADADGLGRLPAGAFALVPGPFPHKGELRQALTAAHSAGVAAVAIRDPEQCSPGTPSPDPGIPLPVVAVPSALAWGELYEMVTTLLAAAGGIAPRQPSDRPMEDLFAFADAAAAAVGGAVSIEDAQGQMLAYSNLPGQTVDAVREAVILQRRVPLTEANRAEYLELSRATGVVRFTAGGDELPRLAAAVRAGDQILGFMWAIDDGTLPAEAHTQLDDAARMAAIHLVRARATGDVARRTHDDALRRLLDGTGDRSLLSAVGLEGRRATGVLAVRPVPDPERSADGAAVSWLGGLVALSARVQHPDALCVTIDGTAYLVIASGGDRLPDLTELAWTIVERSAGHAGDLQIGLATVPRADELAAARRDADRALAALAERGERPAVASIDAVRGMATLAALREVAAERPDLLDGPVRTMVEPGHQTPAWTVPTLQAYFDAFGSLPGTASLLDIHPNTLRYRLRRITELFDLDLDDPDERLVLALQLRLLARTAPRS